MTRLKLPIGIQTFAKLREEGCYYADKTPFALQLIEQGTHYFLSRPRRFGKSLFIAGLELRFGEYWYRLGYPNHEVYRSLINGLLDTWTPNRRLMLANKRHLGDVLPAKDFDGLETLIGGLFSSIPSDR